MIEAITLARPYAKAAFEAALAKQQLSQWQQWLEQLAAVIADDRISNIIKNPTIAPAKQLEMINSIVDTKDSEQNNFLALLAEAERLILLPQICQLFEKLKAEHDRSISVEVVAAMALNDSQQQTLLQALEKRLNKKVSAHFSVDESILGGAIIRAGDLVIDGSGRGQLKRLGDYLERSHICN